MKRYKRKQLRDQNTNILRQAGINFISRNMVHNLNVEAKK